MGGETAALSRIYEYFWKKVRGYTYLHFLNYKCYVGINVSYDGSRDGNLNSLSPNENVDLIYVVLHLSILRIMS